LDTSVIKKLPEVKIHQMVGNSPILVTLFVGIGVSMVHFFT
jgi:hypothetical protein